MEYVIIILLIIICSNIYYIYVEKRNTTRYKNALRKSEHIVELYNRWLIKERQGKKISDFLEYYGYVNVAIYGLGHLGKALYYDLRDSKIDVKYGIDKNKKINVENMEVYHSCEAIEKVDAIIITSIFACEEIEREYGDKLPGVVLSIEDIIDEM